MSFQHSSGEQNKKGLHRIYMSRVYVYASLIYKSRMDAREAGSLFGAGIFWVLTAIDYIHCPKNLKVRIFRTEKAERVDVILVKKTFFSRGIAHWVRIG